MSRPLENETSSDFSSTNDADFGWINYFLSLKHNNFFCQIGEDWIKDKFNLKGLGSQISNYDLALELILDLESDEEFSDEQMEMVRQDAETLYGLIHVRYILTTRGLYAMMDKFRQHDFGSCPRVLCHHQNLLPVGLFEQLGKGSVKLYCAQCKDVYSCNSSRYDNIDGAYFGTTFPHLFFLVFPELQPKDNKQSYLPTVFSFKLHPTSHEKSLEAAQKLAKAKQATKKRR